MNTFLSFEPDTATTFTNIFAAPGKRVNRNIADAFKSRFAEFSEDDDTDNADGDNTHEPPINGKKGDGPKVPTQVGEKG